MYENWLVSDVEALKCQPGRFAVSDADARRVVPNRADRIDAMTLLKRMCKDAAYEKVRDSERILTRADVMRMAENSRSFRRFLRVVGHPSYQRQSASP